MPSPALQRNTKGKIRDPIRRSMLLYTMVTRGQAALKMLFDEPLKVRLVFSPLCLRATKSLSSRTEGRPPSNCEQWPRLDKRGAENFPASPAQDVRRVALCSIPVPE